MLSTDSIIICVLILFLLVILVIYCITVIDLKESNKKIALLKEDNARTIVLYTERITKLQDFVDELIRDGKCKDKQIYELSKKLEKIK